MSSDAGITNIFQAGCSSTWIPKVFCQDCQDSVYSFQLCVPVLFLSMQELPQRVWAQWEVLPPRIGHFPAIGSVANPFAWWRSPVYHFSLWHLLSGGSTDQEYKNQTKPFSSNLIFLSYDLTLHQGTADCTLSICIMSISIWMIQFPWFSAVAHGLSLEEIIVEFRPDSHYNTKW